MKNFDQLASQIVAAIKENGAGEITGDALQGILLAMKDKMQLSCFEGVATTETTPVTDHYGEHFYLANAAGTYSNFDGVELDGYTVVVFYKMPNDITWSHMAIGDFLVENSVIQDSANAVSGGAVYDELETKADQSDFELVQQKVSTIEEGAQVNVIPDWDEDDSDEPDYIKNKPSNLVQDAEYIHTDNNFTTALKDKLDNIEDGAEVNVQADWDENDSSKDSFIKNKPENLVQDGSYVHTDNNYTDADKTKLANIEAGAEVNVQADWGESDDTLDSYIKNKPTDLVRDPAYVHTDNNFTAAQKTKLAFIAEGAEVNVQSDWDESDTTADAYIKNKPANLVQDASYVHTDNNFTAELKNKLNGIAEGAEVNVQPDWDEADSSSDAYIKNKPDLSIYATQTSMTTALSEKADASIIPVICDAFAQMEHQHSAFAKIVSNTTDRYNVYAHNVDADSMSINGMPMVLVASTAGAPGASIIPDNWDEDTMGQWLGVTQFIGQIYIDTVSKKVYISTSVTNSTADWVVMN